MDYESFGPAEMRQAVLQSIRELEGQHFGACIQIAANKGIPGANQHELEQKRDAIATGIRNLKREYSHLLTEPVEDTDPELIENARGLVSANGRVLETVGGEHSWDAELGKP